ncbi:uncharacterized protein BXIN_0309 [Babesia sp. Xinjiang]|uniref:uncharacterized protein n=1 Tax=Babesia sp. Xinjiang TaxID=462227 RepID=UPI000A2388F3|nr:uncharacterized protein BXIN_0298 [Babesia sp. Xinjiang]XP_028871616.1 uncharacterized protein BXIN_0309 [Babesia sp. Xinjiang]ORM41099.1 hypothetical protein BXIN_0298 [Babesia sp. Xinjiang]ORM41160.1 hypothetical protein BXIN_0309 [Babesia sp. Xinjiang]
MDPRQRIPINPNGEGVPFPKVPPEMQQQMKYPPRFPPMAYRMEYSAPMVEPPMSDSPGTTPRGHMPGVPYHQPPHSHPYQQHPHPHPHQGITSVTHIRQVPQMTPVIGYDGTVYPHMNLNPPPISAMHMQPYMANNPQHMIPPRFEMYVKAPMPFNQPRPGDQTCSPRPQLPPPKPDISKMDTGKLLEQLVTVTDVSNATEPTGPPLEEKLQNFGNTIADILKLNAEILESSKLTAGNTEGANVDMQKLDSMTAASSKLFSNVANISQEMHDMTDKLPPFYTRSSPYFRNLEIKSGGFTSFSHTHIPQAAVSAQLVRLQAEFLQKHPIRPQKDQCL